MEGETVYEHTKINKNGNILLKGPEVVSPDEVNEQTIGRIAFTFGSERKQYHFEYHNGKSYFAIVYFDSLPPELNNDEKKKFTEEKRSEDGKERTVYIFKYGDISALREEPEEGSLDQNNGYLVAERRDFKKNAIDVFFANDSNREVLIEILRSLSSLNDEEISDLAEKLFEAYQRQDNETIQNLLKRFSEDIKDKLNQRIIEEGLPKPKEMQTDDVVEIMKNKRVLFYTGAGISMASGVYGMKQLKDSLGIDLEKEIDGVTEKAISDPEGLSSLWEEFVKATINRPPTAAHNALSSLSQRLRAQVFTENVDRLHERSGISATHISGPWLRDNISPEWLKDIDVVITVGLSYDDRGFLGWYKENNPSGKIIAINSSQPYYLGQEDYLLRGDCQKILPEMAKKI